MRCKDESQIETIDTLVRNNRFSLCVDGVIVRVTRYGTSSDGQTHFEIAGEVDGNVRDVFPTDRGYVEDGEVYMVSPESVHKNSEEWEWTAVGVVDYSTLRVGESVGAELRQKKNE